MKKELLFLLIIFILAAFLRFYRLSSVPLGLYLDEAAIGYNSYSIGLTGKDEYGKSFPVYFRSFGDYKMPLYIYLSVIPIKLFGLNIFSIRFLSAFSGSITVLVVYFLTKELFSSKTLAILNSLLFAILPWTVFLSRMALEMQLGLFLMLLAILFHLRALRSSSLKLLFLAVGFYSLAAYSYHTEKFIAPLVFVLWSFLNYPKSSKKEKLGWWKNFICATLVLFILLWPQAKLSFSSGANARINSLSYFNNSQLMPYSNYPLAIFRKWAAMYISYFSPRNLFYNPDPDLQRSLPQISVFYSWMVIFFLIGIYSFLKKQNDQSGKRMILLLLLISPLPASLTGDPFSTFRAFPIVFPLTILVSLGILKILAQVNKVIFVVGGGLVLIISLGFLWRNLYILLPNERYLAWKYGYEQLTEKISDKNYSKILIDDPLGVSYAEILFFSKFSPSLLQKERRVDLNKYYQLTDFELKQSWDKYEVRSIFWKEDVYKRQLIIATPIAVSENQAREHFFDKVFVIIGPDRKVIFNGYLTNPELKMADDLEKIKR